MIAYADGTAACIGDCVDLDGESGIVEAIVDSKEQQEQCGLMDRGLMFKTESLGLVFESVKSITWDSIVFLSRRV